MEEDIDLKNLQRNSRSESLRSYGIRSSKLESRQVNREPAFSERKEAATNAVRSPRRIGRWRTRYRP